MTDHSFKLSGPQQQLLVTILQSAMEQKSEYLRPRFLEVLERIQNKSEISGQDAYQARYLRDAMSLRQEGKESLTDLETFLQNNFFPAPPPKPTKEQVPEVVKEDPAS